jgi:hypothetical protein
MIRKQLYLDEHHDRALKERARELGLSEAEVVRRALDAALEMERGASPRASSALDDFLASAAEIARRGGSAGRAWTRDDLHDERLKRWQR